MTITASRGSASKTPGSERRTCTVHIVESEQDGRLREIEWIEKRHVRQRCGVAAAMHVGGDRPQREQRGDERRSHHEVAAPMRTDGPARAAREFAHDAEAECRHEAPWHGGPYSMLRFDPASHPRQLVRDEQQHEPEEARMQQLDGRRPQPASADETSCSRSNHRSSPATAATATIQPTNAAVRKEVIDRHRRAPDAHQRNREQRG